MWTASFFLGNFAGPTFAGFLVEHYGFRFTTFVFLVLNIVIFAIDLMELTITVRRSKKYSIDNFIQHLKNQKNTFSHVKYSKLDQGSKTEPKFSTLEQHSI